MSPNDLPTCKFDDQSLFTMLLSISDAVLDRLPFGVIGFDEMGVVRTYNAPEARWAGLDRDTVIGSFMFEAVAPCMNNYLIGGRFSHALENDLPLDVTLDFVLTLRMRPTPCRLRLLANTGSQIRFVLIDRK